MTNQLRHTQSPHPSRRPSPAARRALTVLGALLLPLAAAAAAAPSASATPQPSEPPAGPPPPPPAVTAPGLPLWAVLVIVGGTITLATATTLITLALQPGKWRRPRPPGRTASARAMHQPLPAARPAREHTSAATPPDPPHPPAAGTRRQPPTSPPQHRRPS